MITKSENNSSITPGDVLTYTLRYTNTGNIGANNVLVTETIPANTSFLGPAAIWSCGVGAGAGALCSRNVGNISGGGNGTLQFAVRISLSVPSNIHAITNTVRLRDDGTNGVDPNPINWVYTRTLPLIPGVPALTLTKSANVSTITPGGTLTYTLQYTNTGNADATNVIITDTIPVSTTFVSGTGWTCPNGTSGGAACTRNIGTVVAGTSNNAQFVVRVSSPLPSSITQIINIAMIADDNSHTATASRATTVNFPASTWYLDFPFISRGLAVPTPTPTVTPTPTRTPIPPTIADPKGMVSDPARDRLWLVNHGDGTVAVFRESTLTNTTATLLAKVAVGTKPFGIGMVDDKIYVANNGGTSASTVSVMNAATMTKIKDIALSTCGNGATHLAVNPNTHRVYVSLYGSTRVAVINSLSDSIIGCVPVNAGTFGIAVHPASNSIFVGNRDGLDLWRIDGNTNAATQVVNWSNGQGGGSPYYVWINPTTNLLFVMVGLPNSSVPDRLYVYSIDNAGNLGTPRIVAVGNTGEGGYLVQSQCSGMVFIAESADDVVRILNSDLTLFGTVTAASGLVDQGPYGLLENATLKRVYVSNKPSNTLKILNECPGPVSGRAPIPATPSRTATATMTNTPAITPTIPGSVMLSRTPTRAATSTPTLGAPMNTSTPTRAPTNTPTPARSLTNIPTPLPREPTNTPTPVQAPSPTATLGAPTSTPTRMITATRPITTITPAQAR
ncbi:PE-PGRS family protein PE_PGRS18 [Gammaproteobacteria bacterium]|nr:PE-PGRS family protein PE_PGRS18 [Gammaproteobacteria bacterium]